MSTGNIEVFNDLIDRIKAEEAAEITRLNDPRNKNDPRNNRRGIFELCDDRDLLEKPLADFVYDPRAVIFVGATTGSHARLLLDVWREALLPSDGYSYRQGEVVSPSGGSLRVRSLTSQHRSSHGTRCKAVYLHYSAFNSPYWDQIHYALRPCVVQP